MLGTSLVVAAIGAIVAAIALGPTTGLEVRPAAAAGRTLTVTPATELGNQVVQVNWTGFTPTTKTGMLKVIVVQCKMNPKSVADCFMGDPFPSSQNGNLAYGITAADGTGSTVIEIRPSARLATLDCRQANPCELYAWEIDGKPLPTVGMPPNGAAAPLAFAKSASDCTIPNGFDVRAEGEASSAANMYGWAAQVCEGSNKLAVDYTETSSEGGRDSFLHDQVDLGATSLPATADELSAAGTQAPFQYAPLAVTGVALVYNMVDGMTGKPITDLTLTPRLVARALTTSSLFMFFEDPEFKKLNPGHSWPYAGLAQPLVRAERNADAYILTDWIAHDKAASDFMNGNDQYKVGVVPAFKGYHYPTDIFENAAGDDGYVPRSGQYEVAQRVFHGVPATSGSPTSSYGYIGVVDLTAAKQFGLPIAKIVNPAGNAVLPDDAALMAGYKLMTKTSGVLTPSYSASDPTAYPLVKVDYGMVRTHPTKTDDSGTVVPDPVKIAHMKSFLNWVATAGQTFTRPGTLPLPSELVAETKAVADSISDPTPPTTTTVPTTSTTVPTTATTTDPNVNGFGGDTSGGSFSVGGSYSGGSGGSGGTIDGSGASTGSGDGTPVASGPATKHPLAAAPTAPDWFPVAQASAAGTRYLVPALFGTGLVAGLAGLVLLLGPKASAARKALLGKGGA